VPLGDGDEKDQPRHLCVDTVRNLPRCMDMIAPEQVVAAICSYQTELPRTRPSGKTRARAEVTR